MEKNIYTFKFNHTWLQEIDLKDTIRNSCVSLNFGGALSKMETFTSKPKAIKEIVISWEKRKKIYAILKRPPINITRIKAR